MIRWFLVAICCGLILMGCGPAETDVPRPETAGEAAEPEERAPVDTGPEVVVTSREEALAAMSGSNDKTRWNGVRFLTTLGAEGVPDLIQGLSSSYEDVRGSAAVALGELGETAMPALPALKQALNDPNSSVRTLAAGALGALGDESALPDLRTAAKDSELCVSEAAEEAIKKIEE